MKLKFYLIVSTLAVSAHNVKTMAPKMREASRLALMIYDHYVPELEQGRPVNMIIKQIYKDLDTLTPPQQRNLAKTLFVAKYAESLAQKNPEQIVFIDENKLKEKCYRFRDGTQQIVRNPKNFGRPPKHPGYSPWTMLSLEELLEHYSLSCKKDLAN